MGPVDSQPQTDSSATNTTGQENETTDSTDATENTEDYVDPTTNTETEPTEDKLSYAQKNAIAMLYHLATTTEQICISKNNRVILEDIYTALLNETNPGAIDETTQDHLENVRSVIGDFPNFCPKIIPPAKSKTLRSLERISRETERFFC